MSSLSIPMPDQGVLFVVTGPSGVGKSTLVKRAMGRIPGLFFSVSATTRARRTGESDGVDYHFLTGERFSELLDQGAFLEHATVYDRSYGTLREPVQRALDDGQSILLDIDMVGALNVRRHMPQAVLVFLAPPSLSVLEARLRGRGTDSEAIIAGRMAQVAAQTVGCDSFDYIVVNDNIEAAHATFEGVLLAEMSRRKCRTSLIERLLAEVDDISQRGRV